MKSSEKSKRVFNKPDAELQKIWKDACKYYEERIASKPDYIPPAEYAVQEFSDAEKPKRKKKSPLSYHTGLAQTYINEHTYIVGVQHLCKGGFPYMNMSAAYGSHVLTAI